MNLSILENGTLLNNPCQPPIFDETCDVLCVGAGSAGCYAADAAAREGAKVILLEWGENIGGMHVCGNVTKYYYGACGGSYEQDDLKSSADTVFLTNERHWEQRQIRLTERLLESGVQLCCRHSVLGLYWEEDRVVGVLAFDGERKISIKADITIDATSDGHLIRLTDAPKQYGRPSDGSFVPFGVFLRHTKDGELLAKNNDMGIMDHYSGSDFSKRTIQAHSIAGNLLKDTEMVCCALHTGVREGLTYEGEEPIRHEDVLRGKRAEKVLFWAYSDLDRHGSLRATEEEVFQNWWVIANLSTVLMSIPVSMGSVVPKGVRGLVSAGRCLSCDTYLQSAVRMNRDMFRMGECIGTAAAMASAKGVDFLAIDYEKYLERVQEKGCFGAYSEVTFAFDNTYKMYLNKMASLGREPDPRYEGLAPNDRIIEPIRFDADENFHLLKTDAPGVALWSCYLDAENEALRDRLHKEMATTDDWTYQCNCAIALGLMADHRSVPTLREMIERRDCVFFTDNRRSNQFRSAIATCLLGRLGEEEDLPLLFEILKSEEVERSMYHTLQPNYLYHNYPDRNFVYFAMVTHTCMAIYNIYQRCELDMAQLHQFFSALFEDGKVMSFVTEGKAGTSAEEEMSGFIAQILDLTK